MGKVREIKGRTLVLFFYVFVSINSQGFPESAVKIFPGSLSRLKDLSSFIFLLSERFIDSFPQFSKARIRKDLMKGLENYLEYEDPGNLIAAKSLEILKFLTQ